MRIVIGILLCVALIGNLLMMLSYYRRKKEVEETIENLKRLAEEWEE